MVAAEIPIAADDSVAGHEECQFVCGTSLGDCADRSRLAEGGGNFDVAGRLAERDLLQSSPHPRLECGALDVERQVEVTVGGGDETHDPIGPILQTGIIS